MCFSGLCMSLGVDISSLLQTRASKRFKVDRLSVVKHSHTDLKHLKTKGLTSFSHMFFYNSEMWLSRKSSYKQR